MQIMHTPKSACSVGVRADWVLRFKTCGLPVSRFCLVEPASAVVASGLPKVSLIQGVGPVCWLPVLCALLWGWNRWGVAPMPVCAAFGAVGVNSDSYAAHEGVCW